MIALYVGIYRIAVTVTSRWKPTTTAVYRIAVGLHRRSVAQRERSIACLVSMAGSTVTQIGSAIGMTRAAADGHGPTPADAPAAPDDDEDDEDETPHVASRLPTLLLPATSFALFGRLGGASRRHQQVPASSRGRATAAAATATSSTEIRLPHRAAVKTAPPRPGATIERSPPSKSLSSAVAGSEAAGLAAADAGDGRPSAGAARRKRDAASAVTARPEDLHDLPYFDDEDDFRPPAGTPNGGHDAAKMFEFGVAASSSSSATAGALGEQRVVRFVAATEDVVVARCDAPSPPSQHHDDAAVPPETTPCNGDRRPAAQSTSSSQHGGHASSLMGHVWRHMVVHREGRHAESRLEKSPEPDEKQALLRTSCPRHGG